MGQIMIEALVLVAGVAMLYLGFTERELVLTRPLVLLGWVFTAFGGLRLHGEIVCRRLARIPGAGLLEA